MSNAIECRNVWKKYTRGEKVYSLRDAIPKMIGGLFKPRAVKNDMDLKDQEFWALKDVSFEVKQGEVVGIIGANGAGKSTMLKMLSGIIKPNKGDFKVNGRLSALIEITAGFHPDFTGRENVYFNGSILGMTKKEIDSKFDQIVEFSGIEEFIDTPVKRYSSGMYARLGFAVAAHINPDVLLVDEVLAVGDLNFQAKCAEKMRDLLNTGTTIALVSHNTALVQSLCSKVIVLDHGQVAGIGAPEKVIPLYQNIVYQKREEELKKKLTVDPSPQPKKEQAQAKIQDLILLGTDNSEKNYFPFNDPIVVQINYQAYKRLQSPIFGLTITRADGIVCCGTNSRDSNFTLDYVEGQGSVKIEIGAIHLGPGVYHLEASIWDREVVHPYAISEKTVFRIQPTDLHLNVGSVILPFAKWTQK